MYQIYPGVWMPALVNKPYRRSDKCIGRYSKKSLSHHYSSQLNYSMQFLNLVPLAHGSEDIAKSIIFSSNPQFDVTSS